MSRRDVGVRGIVIFYIAFTTIITFPYILHPATTMIGPIGGDVSASIAKYETLTLQGANPFTTPTWTNVSWPAGVQANLGVDRVSFLSVLFLWLGSLTVGSVAAHSLEAISGYLLTAIITFLFLRKALRSTMAAGLAGFIVGFSPHMLSIARAAPTYTHMWLYILPIWAFWSVCTTGLRKRNVLLAALSIVPALFWTPYFALHALLVAGSCLLVTGLLLKRQYPFRALLGCFGIVAGIWLLLLGSYWYIGTHSPSTVIPARTTQDAYEQAAHPLMYIVPGSFSVWGHGTNQELAKHVPTAAATNLYVGLSTLALAAIAITYTIQSRPGRYKVRLPDAARPLVWMAVATVGVCFIFSLPPVVHIGSVSIPTPNKLVVEAVPSLRAGQRLVMPMMAALALLAGIGLYSLRQRVEARLRPIVVVGVVLIVILDLWALPNSSATTIPQYPALKTLSMQAIAPAVQYQAGAIQGPPGQFSCTLQAQHHMPLVNDCVLGRSDTNPNQAPAHIEALQRLPICEQLTHLQSIGVRYVIFDHTQSKVRACLESQGSTLGSVLAIDDTYTVYTLAKK